MILGVILIVISIVALYLMYTTDLENSVVDEYFKIYEIENRIYLHLGILICIVIGVVSIVMDMT